MRAVAASVSAAVLCVWIAAADNLPRHGIIGLTVGPGLALQRVTPGGAGEAAGIQVGDILQSVDGVAVATVDRFVRAVLDQSAMVRGARRRVIVTRPNGVGRMPAALLMQGLGSDTVDNTDRQNGYGRAIGELEQRGFVTMRVEKTGEGDSEGPDCMDLAATPDLKAEGYVAGLRALKQYGFVDPAKVFVFAHSLGPVVGSLAIAEEPVRGFIAVETVGTSWFAYDVERTRVQEALTGKDPEAVDRAVREYEVCSHRFFVEKLRPEELLKDEACRAVMAPLASPVTTAHQNRYLAEIINRYHAGRATCVEVPGMGHDLGRYEDQKEYLERAGNAAQHPFHMGLIAEMVKWMDAVWGRNDRHDCCSQKWCSQRIPHADAVCHRA